MARALAAALAAAALITAAPAGAAEAPPKVLGASYTTAAGTFHTTRLKSTDEDGDSAGSFGVIKTYATDDPSGREVLLDVNNDGTLGVIAPGTPAVTSTSLTFARPSGERLLGFGERSDAVARTSGTVVNDVTEGPYASASEYAAVRSTIPPWGLREAPDATYFPMPWVLTTNGYGFLSLDDQVSRVSLAPSSWTFAVDAGSLTLARYGDGTIAGALRGLVKAVGAQPAPPAPWELGPWFQTGHPNEIPGELGFADTLRAADAPVSVAETQLRYLPCRVDQQNGPAEATRVKGFHDRGFAVLSYAQSGICSDLPLYQQMAASGGLLKQADGTPYTFDAYVNGAVKPLAYFDATNPSGRAAWQSVLDQMAADGHDGYMEDFGEYAPFDAFSTGGPSGAALHNRYATQYHCAGQEWAARQRTPQVRFVRSGWTGTAPCAPVVWGGDPTTGWGFDGLSSAVKEGLSMGLSGIGVWGSDIGGFFTLGSQKLTPELYARWIEFGAVSGVMRTKAQGIGNTLEDRPQVWEQPTLPIWRRYAKLRTQLYPYVSAAVAEYRKTGLPVMRSLAFVDPKLAGIEDELLFGDSLLAAPILAPGKRSRSVTLPGGEWVNFWKAVSFEVKGGSFRLGRASITQGGRKVQTAAPLEQLPLYARAGALLPMLAPDVDTLADAYGRGAKGVVHAADRRGELDVLAFPRGPSAAKVGNGEVLHSDATTGSWTLRLTGPAKTTSLHVQASLSTLRKPFTPCSVDGLKRSKWSYDAATGALRIDAGAKRLLRVRRAC